MNDKADYVYLTTGGECCYLPAPSTQPFPGFTSFTRKLIQFRTMPTRIVPLDETLARLRDVKADGNIDKPRVEESFTKFVESLKIYNPVPPIQWFGGPHDFVNRLYDQDIFFRANSRFEYRLSEWISGIARTTLRGVVDMPQVVQTVARLMPDGMTSTGQRVHIYFDENYLNAIEAGLAFWIVSKQTCVLFPRPILRFFQERHELSVLHSTLGPAIEYPEQPEANEYYYRGTKVPAFVITNPERITLAHIRGARTREIRLAMIDRFGLLNYAKARGYKPVDTDEENGCILWVKGGNSRPYGEVSQRFCILEMINATPNPDGTRDRFARRVSENCQTAREAVAWTFNKRAEEYHPAKQT